MTVKEAIAWLEKLPDKEISLLIDCPHCGEGNQLARMSEAVLLQSETNEE